MTKIFELNNIIQDYAWGDKEALNKLFGIKNPENKPQAEIWMGAHPKSPSMVVTDSKEISLIDMINNDPVSILGESVATDFSGKLPFLFKVLSAGAPLSIQSHPTLEQAKKGFQKDNDDGIELSAFNRNYKDDNHKPELICALTPFKAMNGFRDISEIIGLLEKMDLPSLSEALTALKKEATKAGLKRFYTWMMTLDKDTVKIVTNEAISFCEKESSNKAFETLLFLNRYYPNDIGIMGAIFLNVIDLQPGEAMFLNAGELHAYLKGTGMEIMASSDNVLRGGLTPKHVNVPELLSTLSFNSGGIDILSALATDNPCEKRYKTPVTEFDFTIIEPSGLEYSSKTDRSVEILFCSRGNGRIIVNGDHVELLPGKSYLVPASVKEYKITGDVTVYKGDVPSKKK